MHLWPLKSGLWSHKTGWSLKSGQICKKNCWSIQIVALHGRWSLNSGVSDDKFYCTAITDCGYNYEYHSDVMFPITNVSEAIMN